MSSNAAAGLTSVQTVREAFIQDGFAYQCSYAQKRTFLRSGIAPAVGQRVELLTFLDSSERGDMPFRLSGEVTVVHQRPAWKSNDRSGAITPDDGNYFRPSCSPEDYGPNGGSSMLAFVMRKRLPQERANRDGSMPSLVGIWDSVYTNAQKEGMVNQIVKKFGALHGQRVVCEGR